MTQSSERFVGPEIHPRLIIDVLRRRLGIILVSVFVAVGLTLPALWLIPKQYKATVKLLITEPNLTGNTTIQTPAFRRDQEVSPILKDVTNLITSEEFLTEARIKLLGLSSNASKINSSVLSVKALKEAVEVQVEGASLEIGISSPDRQLSLDLAAIIAEQFKDWAGKIEVNPTKETAKAVKEKIVLATAEITKLQQELEGFKLRNGGVLPEQTSDYVRQKEQYQTLLVTGRVELERLRNEWESLQSRLKSDLNLRVDPETPVGKKILELKAELARLQATHKENHPDVVQLTRQLNELETSLIQPESSGNRISLSTPYRTVESRAKEVRMQIAAYEKSLPYYQQEIDRLGGYLNKIPTAEQRINELMFQLRSKQEILDRLNQEQSGALLSEQILTQVQSSKFVTVSTPEASAAVPSAKLLLIVAAGAGLLLGFVLAVIFELLDPVVYRQSQLEAQAGLPILASIPERSLLRD